MSIVAFIPARSGSKRIPNKNIRPLNGHPLLAYAIASAIEADIFGDVMVSTDSQHYADIAMKYGATAIIRPPEISKDTSCDIEWVKHALSSVHCSYFAILRPTNPFRSAEMIREAWGLFDISGADSLRAMQPISEHPGKMWKIFNGMARAHDLESIAEALYDQPTQSLEQGIYIQNASLQISKTINVFERDTLTGTNVIPYITKGYTGFDINTEDDWIFAEMLIEKRLAKLPETKVK